VHYLVSNIAHLTLKVCPGKKNYLYKTHYLLGIGAEDTYFEPLEEIGRRSSKQRRSLDLVRDIREHPLAYGKMDFNGDRNLFPFQLTRRKKPNFSEFTVACALSCFMRL